MNTLAVDLKSVLVKDATTGIKDAATSPTADWAAFIGNMPNTPDRAVRLRDSGGPETVHLMDGTSVMRDRCQILVRGRTYTEAYAKAKAITDCLDPKAAFNEGGSLYWHVTQTGAIAYLEQDEARRELFTVNLLAWRQ